MTYVGIDLHSRNMTLVAINDNGKLLPGFGLVCAWMVVAEIGDITQFPSPKQFTSYCRLVPGSKDSGGKHRHRSKNKDGNRYLLIAFNQAAIITYRDYPVVKEFYKRINRRAQRQACRPHRGGQRAGQDRLAYADQEPGI